MSIHDASSIPQSPSLERPETPFSTGSLSGRRLSICSKSSFGSLGSSLSEVSSESARSQQIAHQVDEVASETLDHSFEEEDHPSLQDRVEDLTSPSTPRPSSLSSGTLAKIQNFFFACLNFLLELFFGASSTQKMTQTRLKTAGSDQALQSALDAHGDVEGIKSILKQLQANAGGVFFKQATHILSHIKKQVQEGKLEDQVYSQITAQVLQAAGSRCPVDGSGMAQETSEVVQLFSDLGMKIIEDAKTLNQEKKLPNSELAAILRNTFACVSNLSTQGAVNEYTRYLFQGSCLGVYIKDQLTHVGDHNLPKEIRSLSFIQWDESNVIEEGLPRSMGFELQVEVMNVEPAEAKIQALHDIQRFTVSVGAKGLDQPTAEDRLQALTDHLREILPEAYREGALFDEVLNSVLGQINQGYLAPSQKLFSEQIGFLPIFSAGSVIELKIELDTQDESISLHYHRGNDGSATSPENVRLNLFPDPKQAGVFLLDDEGDPKSFRVQYDETISVRVPLPSLTTMQRGAISVSSNQVDFEFR